MLCELPELSRRTTARITPPLQPDDRQDHAAAPTGPRTELRQWPSAYYVLVPGHLSGRTQAPCSRLALHPLGIVQPTRNASARDLGAPEPLRAFSRALQFGRVPCRAT